MRAREETHEGTELMMGVQICQAVVQVCRGPVAVPQRAGREQVPCVVTLRACELELTVMCRVAPVHDLVGA